MCCALYKTTVDLQVLQPGKPLLRRGLELFGQRVGPARFTVFASCTIQPAASSISSIWTRARASGVRYVSVVPASCRSYEADANETRDTNVYQMRLRVL